MEALVQAGYESVSLSAVCRWLNGEDELPARPVVITFDDGYASVYEEAWPLLQTLGLQATLFLIAAYCGKDNQWPSQPAFIPRRPLLTWEQAAEMASGGCELGAHTCTHPPLPTLDAGAAMREIRGSQEAIVARLGVRPNFFAYPYGQTNPALTTAVRRHFQGAVSTRLGLATSQSDPYLLERIDAYYLSPRWIKRMQHPLFRAYLQARRLLRAVRRRLV